AVLKRIIEVIDMTDHSEEMKKYYSDEAWAEVIRRREAMVQKLSEIAMEGTRKWEALFKEVEASLPADPAGPGGQRLLDLWHALGEELSGGNQQIKEGLARSWQDRGNWSDWMKQNTTQFNQPPVWEFIRKAGEARKAREAGTD